MYPSVKGALVATLLIVWCTASGGEMGEEPDYQRGRFNVEKTHSQLLGLSGVRSMLDPLDEDETVSWYVYVPDTYDPSRPAGLMVYISPTSSGQMRTDWEPVVDTENLIWISANQSGNRAPTKRRILLATLAPYLAAETYKIDPDRVYVSGFSGGGRAAGILSVNLADLFKGAIFICGAELWSDVQDEHLAAAAPNPYVFLTGSRDFNRALTKTVLGDYQRAGLVNSTLIVVPGMDHTTPNAEYFREAVLYLDRNPNSTKR